MAQLTFGSACSGIEAASAAFSPLGWAPAWFAEIEPFPRAVLAQRYPTTPNLGDMTALPVAVAVGAVDAPDMLCGGTPCQAFSVAGNRGSLADARGNLTLVFCELANEVDAKRDAAGLEPCVVLWENVPGVLSTKDNAFGCLLAGLAGESDALIPPGKRWENAGCVFGPERTVAWRVLDAQYFGLAQRRRRVFVVASARPGFDPCEVLFEREGVRRDTAPSREARQEAAGAAAGGVEECGRTVLAGGHSTNPLDENLVAEPLAFDTTQITSATNRCQPRPGDPCHPISAHAHAPAIAFNARQDPIFGAVVGPLDTDGTTHAVVSKWRVRRLTPGECERLQGFATGWTDVAFRGKPATDSVRYKAIGNSWATTVVAWIGQRIAHQLVKDLV